MTSKMQNSGTRKDFGYPDGYFAASVGTVSVSAIERYIENQG